MKVSVIVCTHNREKYIQQCLSSLLNQTEDSSNYEVLIVDNNSQDSTYQLSQEFIHSNESSNFQLHEESRKGLTFARNKGIKESQFEIITFVDDDAVVRDDFIVNIRQNFEKHDDILSLGGKVIPIFPETPEPNWISKYIEGIVSRVDYGERTKLFTKKYPVGCNMSFRREVFEELGTFNTNIQIRSDEKELFRRIQQKYGSDKILYAPDVYLEHVMGAERVSKEGVKKVSIMTGEGEYYRLMENQNELFWKQIEYYFKMVAALILSLYFFVIGESEKAKYLILVRKYILKGFLTVRNSQH